MPKFGSHILFADIARAKRPDLFAGIHTGALRFGAIGPDTTLFMFDPFFDDPSVLKGLKATFEVLETIQKIKEDFTRIEEELSKPFDDIKDWLSGGLSKDLKYTINAGVEAVMLAAKLGVATTSGTINLRNPIFDKVGDLQKLGEFIENPAILQEYWTLDNLDNFGFPFRMFGHPYTSDGEWKTPEPPGVYDNWWWMDMLHYRSTGQFAQSLLDLATTPVQLSYAKGYATHYAGDVSGHPFINSLVGGPFRTHAYRHLVLETLADTWLWNNVGRGDILGARLDQLIDLEENDAIQVGELVVRAMKQVYKDPFLPKLLPDRYPQVDQFLGGYKLMQQYLRLSTSASVPRPLAPPSTPQELINEIRDLLKNNMPGGPPTIGGNVADFLKAFFSWSGKGLTLLAMIATLPAAVLMRIVALAPRWALYLVNLGIFYLISAIRTMLCLSGWGYCSAEDFRSFGFLESWVTSGVYDSNTYPLSSVPNPRPPYFWLLKPEWTNGVEQPYTFPVLSTGRHKMPDWMIDPLNAPDMNVIRALQDASTPAEAVKIELDQRRSNGFGNAVDFSILLLDGQLRFHDFDLDGDRGYGFKGWEGYPPKSQNV